MLFPTFIGASRKFIFQFATRNTVPVLKMRPFGYACNDFCDRQACNTPKLSKRNICKPRILAAHKKCYSEGSVYIQAVLSAALPCPMAFIPLPFLLALPSQICISEAPEERRQSSLQLVPHPAPGKSSRLRWSHYSEWENF